MQCWQEIDMSNAICEILDENLNIIGYTEYHGSSDLCAPEFVNTKDEVWPDGKSYNLGGWDKLKKCKGHINKKVIIYNTYGWGNYWPTTVCIECKVITGILSAHMPDWGYTVIPDEEINFWQNFRAEGWPKDGDPRDKK